MRKINAQKRDLELGAGGVRVPAALLLVGLAILTGLGACDRVISGAPTGQKIVPWAEPYDRDALLAAMPNYRSGDLSGYEYGVLLAVQNRTNSGFAVTLEVNGQDIERRYVGALTQEILSITDAVVQQTEAVTGIVSANVPFLGTTVPFSVRLKNYVCEDDHIIQNTNFLLAPQDRFENSVEKIAMDDGFQVNAHFVKPGAFVVVVTNSKLDVIELDREWNAVDENADPAGTSASATNTNTSASNGTGTDGGTGTTGTTSTTKTSYNYLSEEIQVLQRVGLGYLIGAGTGPTGPGSSDKIYVSNEEPYDHSAVKAIFPQLVAPDLSGYNFNVLMIMQNRLDSRFAVTLEVNGQQIERRVVAARTQEYFAITADMIRNTEMVTGVSSETIPFLESKPHPFVVRFRDYVFEDGHIQYNTDCVLAPRTAFEPMVVDDDKDHPEPTKGRADIFLTVPSAFVLVMKPDRNDIIELDREMMWQNETDDDSEHTIVRVYDPLEFLPEQRTVLANLGLGYLIGDEDWDGEGGLEKAE